MYFSLSTSACISLASDQYLFVVLFFLWWKVLHAICTNHKDVFSGLNCDPPNSHVGAGEVAQWVRVFAAQAEGSEFKSPTAMENLGHNHLYSSNRSTGGGGDGDGGGDRSILGLGGQPA